jgi:hypothetical protein
MGYLSGTRLFRPLFERFRDSGTLRRPLSEPGLARSFSVIFRLATTA